MLLSPAFLKLLEGEDPDLTSFAEKVEHLLSLYPRENVYAMYVPSGSHDTERLFTKLKEDIGKTKLFYLFQMAYPGAPAIYYGDEIGLDGGKDPECRKAFPWKESNWQVEIREWVKRLIALRKRNPALRRGDFKRLVLDKEQGLYGFTRSMGEESIIVILNFSKEKQNISIPCKSLNWGEGRKVSDLLSIQNYTVSKGNLRISLPPWSGTWIA